MGFDQALYEALLDAFDQGEFEQLLKFGFDLDLQELTVAQRYAAMVFDVVNKARRDGWLGQLAEQAIAQNPNNPRLKELNTLDISSVGDMNQNVVNEMELVLFGSERGHIDGVLAQMKRMTEMMDGMLSRIESIEEQQRQPKHMRLMWSMAFTSLLSVLFTGFVAFGGI